MICELWFIYIVFNILICHSCVYSVNNLRSVDNLNDLNFNNTYTSNSNTHNTLYSIKRKLSNKNKTIKFIPWPHQQIFQGFLKNGTWLAGQSTITSNKIVDNDFNKMDNIQTHAIKEGIFKPSIKNFPKYHIYSSDEANSCVYGRTILFSGDSYMVQMFIGFADILLDQPVNDEIISGKMRNDLFKVVLESLKKLFGSKTKIDFLYYHCHLEDFECAHEAMAADIAMLNEADVFITNIAIHYKALHINDPNMIENYGKELQDYFIKYKDIKITWATGPSYHKPTASSTILNLNSMDIAEENGIPFIDIYTLTDSCNWSNCSSDGGHRARFVNRMKAQMFLNNICSIDY